jgi:hypothetical protein
MLPVAEKDPVTGSYNSALAQTGQPLRTAKPPAIKTLPLGSNVAVWDVRSTVMSPVGANVPVDCAVIILAKSRKTQAAMKTRSFLLPAGCMCPAPIGPVSEHCRGASAPCC